VIRRLLVATMLVVAGRAAAQDTSGVHVRLSLAEDAHVGHDAPPIVLPYATADSAGPRDQPFDLRKELGHVVVLVFYPGDASPGATDAWRTIVGHQPPLHGPNLVLAGISPDSIPAHVAFARAAVLPVKLLSDPHGAVARRYGVAPGKHAPFAAVVVGRDGTVRYIDDRFAPRNAASYVHLDAAVRAARGNR
jgi:peroxiredoxin